MGGQNKGLSRQVQSKRTKSRQVPDQYRNCFNQLRMNPNLLNELLSQNPRMGQNLCKQFPNALNSYQQFAQMVLFFRKSQVNISNNQFIRHNAPKTNLLDRFFMIILNIQKWQQLEQTQADNSYLQDLFIEFMKLFIPNPNKGFIIKLKNYIGKEKYQTLSITQFTSKIIQYFPSISKYMRDYTTIKFRDMRKEQHFLSNFNSDILKQDAVFLALKMPQITGKQIKQLYSSNISGVSFHSYAQKLIGYTGPWLLLIQSFDKQVYRFGTFQSGPINDIIDYQGNLQGFMFTIQPTIRFMTTDKGDQSTHYFFLNTIDQRISKRRKGIGFGGDKNKQNCKLWIDQDLDKSKVFNGNDPTYGYGSLANPQSQYISVAKMEIWGLGTASDLQRQAQYWNERQDEAMKRRKVSKKQFIDGNAAMMFENTFAHRDQVIGQIQRTNKKQEN